MAPHAKRRTAGTNTAIKDVQEDGEITGSDKGDTGREKVPRTPKQPFHSAHS